MSNDLDRKEEFIDTALQVKTFGNNTIPVFGGVKKSDNQAENEYASLDMSTYVDFCRSYLGENFLTPKILQDRLEYFSELSDEDWLEKFPAGTHVCVTPIPCSENGFELDPQEIEDGIFLRTLVLDQQDLARYGFSAPNSNIFKLLPLEIRQSLLFTIPPYSPTSDGRISPAIRENFLKLYEQKFHEAEILFQALDA